MEQIFRFRPQINSKKTNMLFLLEGQNSVRGLIFLLGKLKTLYASVKYNNQYFHKSIEKKHSIQFGTNKYQIVRRVINRA